NKVCLVTGHTGFKGSWLSYWLTKMGAIVIGYSLEPNEGPNHFKLLGENYTSIVGDIRDLNSLNDTFIKYKPEIVFHLAAQALVLYSYENPIETYQTNVMGTMNVFEAARNTDSVKAIVNITSDKCYDNKEWIWGYRENDPMGGYDPYSSSKGCSEILTASYQRSYFNDGSKLLASARAGNVIGGGDWAADRLIPDMLKAASNNSEVFIRSPYATRPWQHVLEPLSGYLNIGWKILEGNIMFADGWNFGPDLDNNISVKEVCTKAKGLWNKINFKVEENLTNHHEANLLMLDCSKAYKLLKWKPVWDIEQTLVKTIEWYKSFYLDGILNTDNDLTEYIQLAKEKSLKWAI
ncbi:MAG: CDP-glucose 4,6-dehydratase, partial [Bacteroidales bacterium]|nr:CDP-glucose 4,6-dehydratase [Bacteroidales bacterium]